MIDFTGQNPIINTQIKCVLAEKIYKEIILLLIILLTMFECKNCGKTFSSNENLQYHITNKVCDKEHKCRHCVAVFTSKNGMYRHMRDYCKFNPDRVGNAENKEEVDEKEEVKNKIIQLEKDNAELKKNMELLMEQLMKSNNLMTLTDKDKDKQDKKVEKKNKTNEKKQVENVNQGLVNNGSINNSVINVNNITLVAYGKEDMSKIDKNEFAKILRNGFNSSIKLTEALHFNPNFPEYHNIYISNMKDKYAMLYDGTNWNLTMKDTLIDKIYDDKKNYIEQNLEQFVESLRPSQINALKRWIDTDDDTPKIKNIKEEIKLLLYNKKDMAIKTHAQTIQAKNETKCKKTKILKK